MAGGSEPPPRRSRRCSGLATVSARTVTRGPCWDNDFVSVFGGKDIKDISDVVYDVSEEGVLAVAGSASISGSAK